MPGYYKSKPARGSGRKPGGVGNARRKAQARPFLQSVYNRQFEQSLRQAKFRRTSAARYDTHRRAR